MGEGDALPQPFTIHYSPFTKQCPALQMDITAGFVGVGALDDPRQGVGQDVICVEELYVSVTLHYEQCSSARKKRFSPISRFR